MSMKNILQVCPKCGEKLVMDADLLEGFCMYCGFKMKVLGVEQEMSQVNIESILSLADTAFEEQDYKRAEKYYAKKFTNALARSESVMETLPMDEKKEAYWDMTVGITDAIGQYLNVLYEDVGWQWVEYAETEKSKPDCTEEQILKDCWEWSQYILKYIEYESISVPDENQIDALEFVVDLATKIQKEETHFCYEEQVKLIQERCILLIQKVKTDYTPRIHDYLCE